MCSNRWAKPVRPGKFVRRANVIPDIRRDQRQAMIFRQNHHQAVRQRVFLKFDGWNRLILSLRHRHPRSREIFLEEHHLTSSVVETKIKRNSPDFEKNTRRMVDFLTEIKNQETAIQQGGGAKAIEAQHKKGRLTARERIAKLIDPHTSFFELGIYAAHEMYEEWGGAPAAGAITGLRGSAAAW
jgi:hypothetical protein